MNLTAPAEFAPLLVLAVSLAMLFAPIVEDRVRHTLGPMLVVGGLLAFAALQSEGHAAYAAVALSAVIHAITAWRYSREGFWALLASAALTGAAAFAIYTDRALPAFLLSLIAIAVRSGVMPLHFGIARLAERVPALQAQQFASALMLVLLHLRFVDHFRGAYELAPALVRYGAVATLVPALLALVQRDLRGFYRNSVAAHGGLLLAAVGAAGHGHYAAALLVAVTLCVAVSGFGLIVNALEERAGPVSLGTYGGRIRSFPILAAAFAFLGAAGVGLPGTAGFIADDLFLHALWDESVMATAVVIVAAACLAVATLRAYSLVFLGPPTTTPAPDLMPLERLVVVLLFVVLVAVGAVPALILGPAEALLGQ